MAKLIFYHLSKDLSTTVSDYIACLHNYADDFLNNFFYSFSLKCHPSSLLSNNSS